MADFAELHEWHEFYFLLGTAAGAFIALLFVALSIGAGNFTPARAAGTRTFMSPVVVHYAAILICSAVSLAPERTAIIVFALVAGLTAVAGLIVATVTTVRVFKAAANEPNIVLIDHFAYGALPAVAYAALLVAAVFLTLGRHWPLYWIAGALLALMLINIRNAWDLMLAMLRLSRKGG